MNQNFNTLLEAIEFSLILEDDQKQVMIATIKAGEPYPAELVDAIKAFLQASISFYEVSGELLKEDIRELDKQLTAKNIQERATEVIAIVDDFMQKIKKIEGDFEKQAENIIKEKGEKAEIAAIRQSLKS